MEMEQVWDRFAIECGEAMMTSATMSEDGGECFVRLDDPPRIAILEFRWRKGGPVRLINWEVL